MSKNIKILIMETSMYRLYKLNIQIDSVVIRQGITKKQCDRLIVKLENINNK